MNFETVADILDHAKKFHEELSRVYARLGEASEREKMKVLLNYMSRHEEHLVECLTAMESDASKLTLDTWFKYTPKEPHCDCFKRAEIDPSMTFEEIIDGTLEVDKGLLDFYHAAVEKAVSPEVKEFFTEVLELEKREEVECLRNALLFDQQS